MDPARPGPAPAPDLVPARPWPRPDPGPGLGLAPVLGPRPVLGPGPGQGWGQDRAGSGSGPGPGPGRDQPRPRPGTRPWPDQLRWKLINFHFWDFRFFPWARKLIIAIEKKAGFRIFTWFRAGWKLTKKKVLLRTVSK